MTDSKLVWSDEEGDLRKKKEGGPNAEVDESFLELKLRKLTSGKGRTVLEITGLPHNKNWCKKLAKNIKKSLGIGGSFKDQKIEVHGEKLEELCRFLDSQSLSWKKIGG